VVQGWLFARTIIEDHAVTNVIPLYQQQFPRFDDAYDALKWNLARRADRLGLRSFVGGVEYRLYRQGPDPLALTPALIVVYTYTTNDVTIHGLRAV
jgi:hypothetical protein